MLLTCIFYFVMFSCLWLHCKLNTLIFSTTSHNYSMYRDATVCRFIPEVMGCGRKCLTLVWWCHQIQSGFLVNAPSVTSARLSLMIRMIMRWNRGYAQIFWHLSYGSVWTPSNGPCAISYHRKWGPFLQMTSVGSHRTPGREKEIREGRICVKFLTSFYTKYYLNVRF